MICPVCDQEKIVERLEVTDHFLSLEKFELVKCACCGMVYTDNPPSPAEIGKYYDSEGYLSHNDNATGPISVIYRGARKFMLARKRKAIEKLSGLKSGYLLDIGCGTGHFLEEMLKYGWNVEGVEINEFARKQAALLTSANILDPLELSDLPSNSFDVITLWHVLEHFHDPRNYMEEIGRLLKPKGICVVALPNIHSFDAIHYGDFWAAYDVPRHLWHFSPSTFERFAAKYGFSIFKIKPLPLDTLFISMMSEKHKKSHLPMLKGIFIGTWFQLKSIADIKRTSSLIYFLRHKIEE
ncbi:MAG: class I SAM-dependent methyltransferase [Bacteroidales bacterium]|jgi:SAM-dependent methyltransferase